MPETIKQTQLFRFDQMAVQVKDKVEPEEADVDRYVGLEHIDPESLKIRRWGEPSDVESSKILFRSGDIIFGKRRAYQRKLAVADFDGICSAHAMVLRPKTDVVLEEFLPFFMQSDIFMDRAVKISVGGLSPTINWRDLAKEEFALPPLEEQRRIAEVLAAIECSDNRHLDLSKACIDAYYSCLSTHFGSRFSAMGNGAPRGSFGMPWPVMELQSLSEIRVSNVDKKVNPSERPVDLCNYTDVYSNHLITSDIDFMQGSCTPVELEKFQLYEGDVLITKDSEDPMDIGVPAIVTKSLDNVVCGYHLAIIRPNSERLNSLFLSHYLSSTRAKCYLYQIAQGVTRFGLTKPGIEQFPICCPPMSEQQSIGNMLDLLRRKASVAADRSCQIRVMKKRFMEKTLEGTGS